MPFLYYCLRLLMLAGLASVAWGQLRINSNSQLPGATVGQAYSFQLVAGSASGPVTFTNASTLPGGITLSSAGLLSGTPTGAGNFSFLVDAEDTSGAGSTLEQFTLNVVSTPLSVQATTPVNATAGRYTSVTFSGQGGSPPYRYSILSGYLPFGMFFNKSDTTVGRIEGTPRNSGTSSMVVGVVDSQNRSASAALSLVVTDIPLALTPVTPPVGTPGADYEFQIPFTGGIRPVTFTTVGNFGLPAGLTLTSGGKIRGIGPSLPIGVPTTVSIPITAVDAAGFFANASYTFSFPHTTTPTITTSDPLPVGATGVAYSKQFTIDDDGTLPGGSWTIQSGTLPGGLTLSTAGLLSGIPTGSGTFNFTVARNIGLDVTKAFTLRIVAAPFQWTGPNPVDVTNFQFATLLTAASGVSNGTAVGPIELIAGTWPRGFDVTSSGLVVAGTPSESGTSVFTVEIKSADGQIASRTVTANVLAEPSLTILSGNPPGGVRGVRYYYHNAGCQPACASNGGGHPYFWQVTSGTVPPGLTLYSDGTIAGVPTTTGFFSFSVQLVDGRDTSTATEWTIDIADFSGALGFVTGSPLPAGATGVPYSTALITTGGTPAVTFALAGGSLPPGLSMSAGGVISGIPTANGTATFDVAATDNNADSRGGPITVIRQFTLSITGTSFAPQITSLAPNPVTAGGPNFILTVNGNFFGEAPVLVLWNGSPVPVVSLSPSQVRASVPAALIANPGTANIQVQNPDLQRSNIAVLTILGAAPVLETLNPSSVNSGSAGFTLTITGTNFQPNTRVEWDGNALNTFVDSTTMMRVNILAGQLVSAGVIPVRARSAQGVASNTLNFTINGSTPSITTITPPSVAAGSPQTVFTVDGANFETQATALWNGQPVTTAFFSPTRLFVTIPATLLRDPGTAELRVRNPNELTSGPRNVPILGAGPQITTLIPNTAQVGSSNVQLTVKGSGFVNGAVVQFNGTDLTPTTFGDAGTLTATIPAAQLNAIGNFPVVVRNGDGQVTGSANFSVTSTTPAPSLTSLNPTTIQQGSAAFVLTLNGSNFLSGAVARWNGTELQTTFQSAQLVTANVPASLIATVSTASVDVRNADGQVSNGLPFQVAASVTPAPVLTALNPPSTTTSTLSFLLVLTGQNFQAGAIVLWNGTPIAAQSVVATQIVAIVPPGLLAFAGSAGVQVRNQDGQISNTLQMPIRQLVPQITSISPLAALLGATEVTLTVTGQNFLPGAMVLWNGITLSTTSPGQGVLIAQVQPATLLLTPGVASIAVRNPDGQVSSAVPFQVLAPPPTISQLDPTAATVGTPGVLLTIRGSGFRPGAQAKWNGSGLFTVVLASNQISATVPAEFLLFEQTASIQVINIDGVVSNSASFQVLPSLTPEVTQLTPSSAPVGSGNLQLGLVGKNFISGAQVFWNGSPLATSFGSGTQLSATVPAALLNVASVAGVAVRNPDGKTSTAVLFVIGEALRITNGTTLPNGITGNRYETAFTAAGGARPYRWRLTGGALPAGLTLSENGGLTGTPTRAGESRFTVEVADATNTTQQQAATLLIDAADLDITSTSPLPPATSGLPYSHILRASAAANVTLQWSIVEGALPAGLVLNARTGEISGVAEEAPEPAGGTEAGRAASVPVRFQFRIQVAAPARNAFRKVFDLTVLPATGQFRITTTSPLPQGSQGRPYRLGITAVAGSVPYAFSAAGSLPPGISLGADGALDGVPTQMGTFNFSVTARDAAQRTATQTFALTIVAASGPVITSGPLLPVNGIGREVDYLVEATDGIRPFTWSIVAGELPAGVTFDPVAGRLSGVVGQQGIFRFNVRVTDVNGGTDTRTLAIATTASGEGLQIATQSLAAGSLGLGYNAGLDARGGLAPYRWSIVSGVLPAGLRLNGDRLEGTPTAAAVANLVLRVTDAFGYSLTRDFLLRVSMEALPGVQITGLADTLSPGQQSGVGVALAAAYPAEITGRLIMDFAPDPTVAGIDPALQFSTGGRTADFRIPAGQTVAVFTGSPAVQTGTVAGTITFRVELSVAGLATLPGNRPDRAVRIVHLPPVLSSVTLERRANGFTLTMIGFATTREMGEMIAEATPAAGRTLQTTRYVVPVAEVFRAWYASAASLAFGTQFRLAVPFDGDASAIQSLTVRLRNSAGESAIRTVN